MKCQAERTYERPDALTPDVAEGLVAASHGVRIETGAGEDADWDDAYEAVGCEICTDREAVFERTDAVLHVRALGAADSEAVDSYREGQIVVGLLGPYDATDEQLQTLADRNVDAFALELIPRSVWA